MFSRHASRMFALGILGTFAVALLLLSPRPGFTAADPWNASQTVQPGDLLKELNASKSASTIVFVGFKRLYTSGHIKGAQVHGTTGSAEGLNELRSWAAALPRSSNLVIYCGCCPMDRCPNIRPAFTVLRDLGFTKLRVLLLPTNFEEDWANKGYAYEKGQ